MLVNLTNHPSSAWAMPQREAAEAFGGVRDVPFPTVPPEADTAVVADLADALVRDLLAQVDPVHDVVHVMGEMTLTYALVARLQRAGIRCVASTTERRILAEDAERGPKTSVFHFVRFRDYPRLDG